MPTTEPEQATAAELEDGFAGACAGIVEPAAWRRLAPLWPAVWRRVTSAFADISLSPRAFGAALGQRFARAQSTQPTDSVAWLSTVHVEDLYLAQACRAGDARALHALDERYLAPLGREMGHTGALSVFTDEAMQTLRVRLLVGRDGEPPRIDGYRGSGPLIAWLRLTLTRLALNLHKEAARETELDDRLLNEAPDRIEPELALLRHEFRDEVARAMEDAFKGVVNEERAILRMHFIDGLSAHDIGAMFAVSGRTIQRRIAETRQEILKRTRQLLGARVGLAPSQLDTIMRLVRSDLNLSLRRMLQPE